MTIHALVRQPATPIVEALAKFEGGFSYPLGDASRFHISHGEDYPRFYRAMGECRVFVAERNGEVLGTLGGAVRELEDPQGRRTSALYIGDLKVSPGIEAGLTLLRLAAALKEWADPLVTAAFGVAMDGTRKTPERYTGRFGIPAFTEIGKIMVLRLECASRVSNPAQRYACSAQDGFSAYRWLTRGGYSIPGGMPAERSAIDPVWLKLESGAACGMLEDTRRAKRLFVVGGPELLSAHLSYFAFKDARSAAELLNRAASIAGALSFPALFCSIPVNWSNEVIDALGSPGPTQAPATVYGAGIPGGFAWHINSSEI